MTISELAKMTGLSIDTIRYYEKMKLISVKKEGYYKIYNSETLETLKQIKQLRQANLSLIDIKFLIDLNTNTMDEINKNDLEKVLLTICSAIDTVTIKLKELETAKAMLNKLQRKLEQIL